jgi:hypothetical protein
MLFIKTDSKFYACYIMVILQNALSKKDLPKGLKPLKLLLIIFNSQYSP